MAWGLFNGYDFGRVEFRISCASDIAGTLESWGFSEPQKRGGAAPSGEPGDFSPISGEHPRSFLDERPGEDQDDLHQSRLRDHLGAHLPKSLRCTTELD